MRVWLVCAAGARFGDGLSMGMTCGIDWGEEHHDVAVLDEAGKLVGRARIRDDAQGFRDLLDVWPRRPVGVDQFIPAELTPMPIGCLDAGALPRKLGQREASSERCVS